MRRLRAGDIAGVLVEATGEKPVSLRATHMVCTCTAGAMPGRIRRDLPAILDGNGRLLDQHVAVANASGLPPKIVCGFVEAAVNRCWLLISAK